MKTNLRKLWTTVAFTVLGFAASPAVAGDGAPAWSPLSCGDAGYGGRPAFTCFTYADSDSNWGGATGMSVTFQVWATPNVNGRVELLIGEKVAPRANTVPTDPIVLKVDGRVVREYKPAEVISYSSGAMPTVTLPFDEALVRELKAGDEFRVEYTDGTGAPQSVRLPSLAGARPIFSQVVERSVSEYRSYYASAGKSSRGAKADSVGQELWGLLGEAADRAPIWLNKTRNRRRMVELKWLEQGKSMEIRTVNCKDDNCKEERWTVRANPQSVVDNKRAGALVVYNEANRPVVRFERINADGSMFASSYDPIILADMSDGNGLSDMPRHFKKSQHARWIRVNVDDYAAGTAQEARDLFGEITKEKQARIAQAQAAERAAEQARREAEEQAALVAAQEEEEERNRPASPNLAQVFASTFANEMAKNGAQQRVVVPAPAYQAGSRPQRVASVAPPVQQPVRQAQPVEVAVSSSYTSHASPVISVSSETPASKLKATPEAIMVCTKPTGPRGVFKCSSPLNTQSGHLEDRSGYRTPEELVSGNEACPNARRLESSTHLVWGCGFGATGNYGYMDRSAGVDVRGRNTYYCYEKQTSCRRTSL